MTATTMEAGQLQETYEPAIPLDQLHESPKNPRTHYDPVRLQELADNMSRVGQTTPLLVRPLPDGEGYEIAAGHRRRRAADLTLRITSLAAVVREMDDATFAEVLNVENLQRDDLTPLEEAQGFRTLMEDAGYDVPRIAERMGRSVKYVYDRLKLLQLVPEAKALLDAGTITAGHGILLARLTVQDQKRALDGVARNGSGGGVFEIEHVDPAYFGEDEELQLDDRRKARSVRELAQWIDRNVRFVPTKVDQADLAFDLPATAQVLDNAQANKLKVVKITREHRVPDPAKDPKERTYGNKHWKRADGEVEPFTDYGTFDPKAKPSKSCEHAVVGLVVAGPGRGEAFMVCIAKEKCRVHWAKEMAEKAKKAKASSNGDGRTSTSSWEAQERRWERERIARQREEVIQYRIGLQLRDHSVAKVNLPLLPGVLVELAIGAADERMDDEQWKGYCQLIGLPTTTHYWPRDGRQAKVRKAMRTVPTETVLMALVYAQTDPDVVRGIAAQYGADVKAIEKAVKAEVAAEEKSKATAEQPVQTSAKNGKKAKGKKRAGDVARARKKAKVAASHDDDVF